jgi:DNA-binding LytR/AlgR family response regulator
MKVLIIEDEPFAQQELLRLLKQTGRDIIPLAMIDTVEDSIDWIQKNPTPDLVFLDIQLADGISFEIFNSVSLEAPVIFTTAYDEFAIRAFELNSIDYLLKPIKLEDLQRALEKLDKFRKNVGPETGQVDEEQIRKVLEIMTGKEYKSRFMVKLGDQIRAINVDQIAYFKAEDNVVFLTEKDGKRYIIDHTLDKLEGLIDPKNFFRLNRSFIAGIGSIKKVSKYFNSRLSIELEPPEGERVLVSRKKVPEFMAWLER